MVKGTVVVNKKFPLLQVRRRTGGGSSQSLPPITDVLGRPLSGPIGSAQATAQIEEANRINREKIQAQQQAEARQQQEIVRQQQQKIILQSQARQPFLQREVTETKKFRGRDVPSTRLYYTSETGEKRLATTEEEKSFKEQTSVLVASEKKATRLTPIKERISFGKEKIFGAVKKTGKETGISFVLDPMPEREFVGETGSKVLALTVGSARFPKLAEVKFVGVTQQGVQPIQTDVLFKVGKQKGFARGITYTKEIGKEQIGVTKVSGVIAKNKPQTFSGYELAVSREGSRTLTGKTNLFSVTSKTPVTESISFGTSTTKGITSKYVGAGIGVQKDKLISIRGITKSPLSTITSKGLLKVTTKTPTTIFTPSGSSGLTTLPKLQTLQQQAAIQTQTAVSSAQPIKVIPTLPRVSFPTTTIAKQITKTTPEYPKVITAQLQKQNQIQLPKLIQKQEEKIKLKTLTTTSQVTQPIQRRRTGQASALGITQVQVQSPALVSALSSGQAQSQAFRTPQILKTKLTTARPLPFIPSPFVPKTPGFVPPFFKKPKTSKQTLGGFKVFGKRFGKFKPIGIGKTEQEAFRIGKRFAGKTLGATFKVPKSKILKLPGFRTKISKKEGTLFIEPRKRRIKKGSYEGEVGEIQMFKRAKKGGKKKR